MNKEMKKIKYDFVIVGAGLAGAIFAHEANKKGYKVLVIDKRNHIGGNCYNENIEGIHVHKYGAHIFHTSNEEVWKYINQFVKFNNFINCPIANYKGEIYNLPFNMNTFNKLWGVITPEEALKKIKEQVKEANITEPKNLEEQAISLVGIDVYEKLIKGYTEKQWNNLCKNLSSDIIKRLPVRLTYDNNYFNDKYQGIPINGYNELFEKLLEGIEVRLNTDFLKERETYENIANKIVFTGMIDEFYNYEFGPLQYRGLEFKKEIINKENYQGVAVVNYTDRETPYTRIIEHKHFCDTINKDKTIITFEYPKNWSIGEDAYYPINNKDNELLYNKYKEKSTLNNNVIFIGRLAEYRYYDMDKVIYSTLQKTKEIL